MRAHWEPRDHVSQNIWDPCSQSSCWEKMLSVDYYSLCRGATLSPKGRLGHPPIRTIWSWLGKGKRAQQLVCSETSVLRQESRGSGKSAQPTQHQEKNHFLCCGGKAMTLDGWDEAIPGPQQPTAHGPHSQSLLHSSFSGAGWVSSPHLLFSPFLYSHIWQSAQKSCKCGVGIREFSSGLS